MKKFSVCCSVAICLTAFFVSAAMAGGSLKSESGWFDFESCAFCKNMSAEEGLLEHSTWETHPIKHGSMTILTVEPEYAAAMERARKKMNELGMKIQAGEVNPMGLQMCQHCQTFGMLMMGGVDMEEVRGESAVVTLLTSDDEAVVGRLHEMARRDTEESALLFGGGSEHPHQEHPSHEHPSQEHPHH